MTRSTLVAAALALVVTAEPASAQLNRTFVSAAGSDSNNCANVATPCRHFQTAVNATGPGGEVVALDPANYGSITVSQAITIEGQGWAYVAPPNGGNGITINTVSGNVTIRGVLLNGDGATGGTNGIVFNSGASLTIADCVAQNFAFDGSHTTTGNGILIQPTTGLVKFVITNTTASNDGWSGIHYVSPSGGSPSAEGVIDHAVATGNNYGILIETSAAIGGSTVATISNIIASNNANGIAASTAGAATMRLSIDTASVSGGVVGIIAEQTANVLLGRSVITGNNTGISNNTSPNTFYTYKDNRINLNAGTDISSPLNTTFAVQ